KNKTFVVKRERKGVKKAALTYETLSEGTYRSSAFTLVKIKLETGRSHQIRIQFASRKNPLFGDGKYGSADNEKNIALWSYSLSFSHPKTKKPMGFTLKPAENSLFYRTGCNNVIE
ncbi:MAG: pseudouridine synthase, partial [Acutalibacteraceae bacterium]